MHKIYSNLDQYASPAQGIREYLKPPKVHMLSIHKKKVLYDFFYLRDDE